MTVTKLPDVGRIQGIALLRESTPSQSSVSLQYTGRNNEWYELKIPLLDALYLLNLLEAMSEEQSFESLRLPPESPRS